jgi:hypothetical protein
MEGEMIEGKVNLHYKATLCLTAMAACLANKDQTMAQIWQEKADALTEKARRTPAPVYYSGCKPWPAH